MNIYIKKVLSICTALILSLSLSACNTSSKNTSEYGLSGSIRMAGSTSMEKLANILSEAFMEEHGRVSVTAEFTGSSAGIEALLSGSVDIGNSSRDLKDNEIESGAVENIVAIDGIVIIVNPENPIKDLSKEDLISIYKGEITNWSELGGNKDPIVLIGRESASGTRDAFEGILDVKDQCKYALELDSTGTVLAKVAATSGGIGYISLDVVNEQVAPLSLNGIEPNEENIKSGDYFLARSFVMATYGEISEQSELVQEFFDYLYSDKGKEMVELAGLIPVN